MPKSSLEFVNPPTIASVVAFKERTNGRNGLFEIVKIDGISINVSNLKTRGTAVVEIGEINVIYKCPKPFRFQVDDYLASFQPTRLDKLGNVSTTFVTISRLDQGGKTTELIRSTELKEGSPTNLVKWIKQWIKNHDKET
ncbi:hypothetical protein [Limnofasciculus baicalensis]|uniref:Uncharacterized protein n=1 Tax=Limnofasciculus baicalensis BBK-W-15 TaxID=2699891 RepID=A0AAE3GUI9_9CYAN|nr:hypothetical protein [Limnofasciculus baicalensis]MCP2728827.1 hypothetical protein [Limnofasciculus baicalensis BBK-W-15]